MSDGDASPPGGEERICSECGDAIEGGWIFTETQAHPDCAVEKYSATQP